MSATDIAKEVVRIANTHGLSKDVIDLMEKKLALLTSENVELKTKISTLEIEVRQLRGQLAHSHPVQQPADTCPYCRRAAGELVKIDGHPIFPACKTFYYRCAACGKEYDRDDT